MQLTFELEGGNFSKAGYASSQIKKILKQLSIDPRIIKRVVVALYEAEVNIVAHAWRGKVLAQLDADKITLTLTDEGPGIPDIPQAMQEGFSTASPAVREMGFGAGMGLPNMKKNVDELNIESKVGVGTTVRMVTWCAKKEKRVMEETKFYHALKIDKERCIGCTHCMTKCPTRAVRIRDGKARILKDWCVDCGECLKACPTDAIYVEQDDFQKIFDYECRVVLVPSVFIGQFSKYTTEEEIFSAIYELGFTHVYQVEFTADMIHREMLRQMEAAGEKPVISSFCPAIVRLIQIRFPALVDNILLVKNPVNATATYYHQILTGEGYTPEQIGLFYVTPCAAKIAALKSADGYSSTIKGVINMDTLYNKVYHILQNRPKGYKPECVLPPALTKKEMRWSQTGGEAKHFSGRCLAIDEIHNVIDFLERMETTTEVRNVDFLELRACDRSCAGGVLTVANRFLAAERIMKRSMKRDKAPFIYTSERMEALAYLKQHITIRPLQSNPKLLYDGTIEEVLKKMEQVRRLMCYLPGIDCGACGNPNCESLAEDIVRHQAQFSDCVFMQRNMEKHGKLDQEHAFRLIEKTWGKDRLNKDCYKKGAKYEGQ